MIQVLLTRIAKNVQWVSRYRETFKIKTVINKIGIELCNFSIIKRTPPTICQTLSFEMFFLQEPSQIFHRFEVPQVLSQLKKKRRTCQK